MGENRKYNNLINYLKELDSVLVAFSGGVDSTFLLKAAKEALGDKVAAITVKAPYIANWEVEEAKLLVEKLGVSHKIVEISIIDGIKNNPENRCYLCKKEVFSLIKSIANEEGYKYVIEGSNFDDLEDYRPGIKALEELKIKSPLLECQLTKDEIRKLSQKLELDTWNKSSYACLLTRIPYGNELTIKELDMVQNAEKYLMAIGLKGIRVRCHKELARIEVNRKDRRCFFDEKILDEVSTELKKIGFKYVTFDLEGYRMGSFNEMIVNKA
ncbi:MAG: ATP-dependent sacrificial sulfur transferase LarE [Eubacteriales bacterium]